MVNVAGVGHQTARRLQALGVATVSDLQLCQLNDLVTEFGGPAAQRLKNLSCGIDDSPVTPTGAPQVQQKTPIFLHFIEIGMWRNATDLLCQDGHEVTPKKV